MLYVRLTLCLIILGMFSACGGKKPPAGPPPVTEADILKYETIVQQPSGEGPFPILFIAPGKTYTMEGELFSKLAREASRAGFFVVRFNWSFATKGGKPSEGLKDETEAFSKLIRYYHQKSFIDAKQTFLIAKSFGSKVLMKGLFGQAQASVLLTPLCDEKATFDLNYGALMQSEQPVQVIISRDDPLCDVAQIFASLSKAPKTTTGIILRGDHNLISNLDPGKTNQSAAVEAMLSFLLTEKNRLDEAKKKESKEQPPKS